MRLALPLVALLLAACRSAPPAAPLPPEIIRVPVTRYIPLDESNFIKCAWAKRAPLSKVVEVASGRKICLLQYEAQLEAIRAKAGSPVED